MTGLRSRRTGAFAALALTFLAILALIVLFIVQPARRFFDRWEEHGLPGSAPRGTGPAMAFAWPPELRWTELEWARGDSLRLSCASLRVVFDPIGLARGRGGIDRVIAGRISVEGASRLWAGVAASLAAAGDSAVETDERPAVNATRIETGEIVLSRGTALGSLAGWVWSPGGRKWSSSGIWRMPRSRSAHLQAQGASTAGASELRVEVNLARDRTVHFESRTGMDGRQSWQLSGRDDGRLVSHFLPGWIEIPVRSTPPGAADFWLRRNDRGGYEGEAHLERLPLRISGDSGWRADGILCLEEGSVSLQEMVLSGGGASIRFGAELPLVEGGEGSFHLDGVWGGQAHALDGTIRLEEALWRLETERRGGGIGFVATIPWGESRLDLRVIDTPLVDLLPWIPFRPPGTWTGVAEGRCEVRSAAGEWRVAGTTTLRDGSVAGLRLLDEIADLGGGSSARSLRYKSAGALWRYERGAVLFDSLGIEGTTLRIRAKLAVTPTDSLLGWIRVVPEGNRGLAALFRLIAGGDGGLDLALTGTAGTPEVTPLDDRASRAWLDSVELRLSPERQTSAE